MVLRPDSVRKRLLKLEEVVSRLESIGPKSAAELERDFREAWVVERGLQLAAEILFDVGNHILSAHFGKSPDGYEEILRELGARDVIPAQLASQLRGLGGLRNILVHDDLDLEEARVAVALERAPAEFSAFSIAVRGWLEENVRSRR